MTPPASAPSPDRDQSAELRNRCDRTSDGPIASGHATSLLRGPCRRQTGRHGAQVWRFRSPHQSRGESDMRISEPKPHEINTLSVLRSEVRKREYCTMMRTSESGHQLSGGYAGEERRQARPRRGSGRQVGVPAVVLRLRGWRGTGGLGVTAILQGGGDRRDSNLAIAAVETLDVARRTLDVSVFVIVFTHSIAVFLILPVMLFIPFAESLHGNDLRCGVMTPEYGGNAQEIVFYRDIRRPGTAVRRATGLVNGTPNKSPKCMGFGPDVISFSHRFNSFCDIPATGLQDNCAEGRKALDAPYRFS